MANIVLRRVAGAAAIIRDKKILLLKRSDNSERFPGFWTFPAGGISEADSSVSDTVIREVKEEIGLDFTPREKFGFYESINEQKRYISLVHLGDWTGEIKLQEEEISEYAWVTASEALEKEIAFAYREVIEDLRDKGLILD